MGKQGQTSTNKSNHIRDMTVFFLAGVNTANHLVNNGVVGLEKY